MGDPEAIARTRVHRLCPFCGAEAKLLDLGGRRFAVGCANKKCGVGARTHEFKRAAKAWDVWDTRLGEVGRDDGRAGSAPLGTEGEDDAEGIRASSLQARPR